MNTNAESTLSGYLIGGAMVFLFLTILSLPEWMAGIIIFGGFAFFTSIIPKEIERKHKEVNSPIELHNSFVKASELEKVRTETVSLDEEE